MTTHRFPLFMGWLLAVLFTNSLSSQELTQKNPILTINEVDYADKATDDVFIELLVMATNELPINDKNKPSVILDDLNKLMPNSTASDLEPGFISIDPDCLKDLKPGDLVVVHGNGFSGSTQGAAKTFSMGDACLKKFEDAPTVSNEEYETHTPLDEPLAMTTFLSFEGTGDFTQIKIGETYDKKVLLADNVSNYSVTTSDIYTYAESTRSPGQANSPENLAFIDNLKDASPFELNCGMVISDVSYGLVEFHNGTAPYHFISGTTELEDYYPPRYSMLDLDCGFHEVVVTDFNGNSATCRFYMSIEDRTTFTHCIDEDFYLPVTDCTDVDEPCISLSVNGGEPEILDPNTLNNPWPITEDSRMELVLADKKGNVIHSHSFYVDIVEKGDSCDDGDNCTTDDVIDSNCNCRGAISASLEIIASPVDNIDPCSTNHYMLTTSPDFRHYTWYYNKGEDYDDLRKNTNEVEVKQPGQYTVVAVTIEGCEYIDTYQVLDDDFVSTTAIKYEPENFNCSDEAVVLSLDGDYSDIIWTDFYGNSLGMSSSITVESQGIYYASFKKGDCDFKAEAKVVGYFDEIKLEPENPVLCASGGSLILELQNLPDEYESITWSDGSSGTSLEPLTPGYYSVTIVNDLLEGKCETILQTEVKESEDMDYTQTLVDAGFIPFAAEIISHVSAKQDDAPNQKSMPDCYINDTKAGTYIVKIPGIGGDEAFNLSEKLLSFVQNSSCCSSGNEVGILIDDICEDMNGGIQTFIDSDYEIKAFIYEDSDRTTFFLSANEFPCLTNSNTKEDSDLFLQIINELICARKSNSNYTLPAYGLYNLGSTEDLEFPGNYSFSSVFQDYGILIRNYREGATVDANHHETELSASNCLWQDGVNVSHSTSEEGNYLNFYFPYTAGECGNLVITVNADEQGDFKNLLDGIGQQNNTLVDFEELFAIEFNEAIQNNNFDLFEKYPECIVDCELVLEPNLRDNLLDPQYEGAVLNILSTQEPDRARCLIDIFDRNDLTIPYQTIVFPDNKVKYLSELNRLFYYNFNSNLVENKEDFKLEGNRVLWGLFGPEYTVSLLSSSYNIQRTKNNYRAARGVIPITLKSEVDIDPFKTYFVKMDKRFDFVNATNGESNIVVSENSFPASLGVIEVPGIYFPFSVYNWKKIQNREDIFTTIDIVTTFAGIGTLSHLYKAKRLFSLTGFFGGADVTVGISHIFLDQSDFCDNLEAGDAKDFCKFYKEKFLPIADLMLLSGTYVASKGDELLGLQKKYDELSVAQKNALKQKIEQEYGTEAKDDFVTFLTRAPCLTKSNRPGIWCAIKEALGDDLVRRFGGDDIAQGDARLENLVEKLMNREDAINIGVLAGEIKALGSGLDVKFLEDIERTVGYAGQLGGGFKEFSVEMFSAWRVFDLHSDILKTDLKSLKRLSNDIKEEVNLINYLSLATNLTTWKKISILKNYGKHIDFLETRKTLDNVDFSKHMDGEIEIVVKGPIPGPNEPPPVLWNKKYPINTFWDEFNTDLSLDPNILDLIRNNGTPSTNISGIHDLNNYNNLVTQGIVEYPINGLPTPINGFKDQDIYIFKPRVKYPDWEDLKVSGQANLSKALIKNKADNSTFWPTSFTKSDMKEYASAAVYESLKLNGGQLHQGLRSFNVTSPNKSVDKIAVSNDLVTSFPRIE